MIADWTASPNAIMVRRISDGAVVRTLTTPGGADGGVLPRFTPDGARVVGSGYLPFLKPDGTWDQKGVIRFWRISDGALLKTYDQQTSLGVTTPVVLSEVSNLVRSGLHGGRQRDVLTALGSVVLTNEVRDVGLGEDYVALGAVVKRSETAA